MNGLALCAGGGGLELGLRKTIPGYRTVCFVERGAFAASILVARMEKKILDPAPIWDNLTTFNGKPWCGKVDIITAGFPCQPFSGLGKRKGIQDKRWLFNDIMRIAKECGKPLLFFENVPGIIQLGLEECLRQLATLGYHAKWGCLPARSAGAPHMRERFFMFANSSSDRLFAGKHKLARLKRIGRWDTEPDISRVDDGTPFRMDRSFCLGNAVVPQQATLALDILLGL